MNSINHKILLLLIFLISVCLGNNYPIHDISLVTGIPEFAGFRYTVRIKRVDIGIMPGLLSLVYTKIFDGPDATFCPALYLGWVFYTEDKPNRGFSSHSLESEVNPFYNLEDLFEAKKTIFCVSIRYCYARTWNDTWRFRFSVGPAMYIDPIKPNPNISAVHLRYLPLPGIMFSFGRTF